MTALENPATVDQPSPSSWTGVLHAWFTTVDHKKLGLMYIISGKARKMAIRIQKTMPATIKKLLFLKVHFNAGSSFIFS